MYWRVAIRVVETRLHRMIQWYFALSGCQNFPFLIMEAMLSLFYIALILLTLQRTVLSLNGILTWSPLRLWMSQHDRASAASMVTQHLRLIFGKILCRNIICCMAVLSKSTHKNDVWELGLAGIIPYLKGLIIIHSVPNIILVLLALVVALTTKATTHNQ